ncbi:MAG: TSUP family transporter [Solirubrobacterales bacterium]
MRLASPPLSPLELIAVAVWSFAVSFAGGLVGLVLGNLRLPLIVLVGSSPPAAAGANVAISGAVEVLRYRRPEGDGGPPTTTELFLNAALVGFGVGLLGGFVGLILGSLRLPAMVKWAGVGPYAAVGTNAAVGVVVGIGGLLGHLPSGIDWEILAVGAAASAPAAYLGARFTGRLDERRLLGAMAAVLVISAIAMGAQAIAG